MAKKQKRNPMEIEGAKDAIMPPPKNTEVEQNNSLENTEELHSEKENKIMRRRRPLKEKAVRQTYSLYPRIIKGVEKYADDYGMTYSQVVTLALTNLIPQEYFKYQEDGD